MAVVGNDVLTLAELKTRLGPDNKVATIIEMLERQDEMIDDIPWCQANMLTTHKTTVRTGLPAPTHRRFNQGVAATRSSTAQVEFPLCQAADRSEVDKDLANLGGNPAAVRLSESKPHLAGMVQAVADTLINGDPVANPTTDDAKIPGLHYYFKDNTTAPTKDHVITAGGSGSDNTSLWVVAWGEDTVCGLYPNGMPAGLQHDDLGEGDAFDASNRRFRAYMDSYTWNYGLAVKDWRAVVRIANIDVSDLVATVANQQALTTYVIQALAKIPSQYRNRAKIYGNATALTAWELGIRADVKAGGGLDYENVGGQRVMKFRGVPVRTCNAITVAESTIS